MTAAKAVRAVEAVRALVLAGVITVLTAPTALTAQDFSWKGRVATGKRLEVKGVNGDITAMFASGNEIEVTAEKRSRRSDPDEVEIRVIEHADGVTICAVYPTPRRARRESEPWCAATRPPATRSFRSRASRSAARRLCAKTSVVRCAWTSSAICWSAASQTVSLDDVRKSSTGAMT